MYNNIYNNGLGKDGKNFNTYVMPSLNVGLQAFQYWVTAKYGANTTQQVVSNPTSDTANQLWYQYIMSQQGQQTSKSEDKTLLYVAIAGLGILALMMMNNNNSKRR